MVLKEDNGLERSYLADGLKRVINLFWSSLMKYRLLSSTIPKVLTVLNGNQLLFDISLHFTCISTYISSKCTEMHAFHLKWNKRPDTSHDNSLVLLLIMINDKIKGTQSYADVYMTAACTFTISMLKISICKNYISRPAPSTLCFLRDWTVVLTEAEDYHLHLSFSETQTELANLPNFPAKLCKFA